jgi:hypothetical protein
MPSRGSLSFRSSRGDAAGAECSAPADAELLRPSGPAGEEIDDSVSCLRKGLGTLLSSPTEPVIATATKEQEKYYNNQDNGHGVLQSVDQ